MFTRFSHLVHPDVSQVMPLQLSVATGFATECWVCWGEFQGKFRQNVPFATGGSEGGAVCWAGSGAVGSGSSKQQGAGAGARSGARGLGPRRSSRAGRPGAGAGCQSVSPSIWLVLLFSLPCIVTAASGRRTLHCHAPFTPVCLQLSCLQFMHIY